MQVYPVRVANTTRLTFVLLVALAASGCQQKQLVTSYVCQDVNIKVDPALLMGVQPKAVYLCGGYKITWVPQSNVSSFEVVFDDSPFGPNNTNFGTAENAYTPPLPKPVPTDLTVYKYTITVVDKNGVSHSSDPHVVTGGGLTN